MTKLISYFTTCAAILVTLMAVPPQAVIKQEMVPYKLGDAQFEGYLTYDASIKGQGSAVPIIHEWWGMNDYIKKRSKQHAGIGYIAYAANTLR